MQIEFSIKFRGQYYALRNEVLRNRLGEVALSIENAATIHDIPNLKKLKGYTSSWRIRMGDYRIGVQIKGDTVIFADFDLREDIYSLFP